MVRAGSRVPSMAASKWVTKDVMHRAYHAGSRFGDFQVRAMRYVRPAASSQEPVLLVFSPATTQGAMNDQAPSNRGDHRPRSRELRRGAAGERRRKARP